MDMGHKSKYVWIFTSILQQNIEEPLLPLETMTQESNGNVSDGMIRQKVKLRTNKEIVTAQIDSDHCGGQRRE